MSSSVKFALLTLLAAVAVGIIYESPHLLIRRNLERAGKIYVPITRSAIQDEAEIYAPQIEEASHGKFWYPDPALLEHASDPSLRAPLGPFVLGSIVRLTGIERFWFWSDAIFPPLLFLLFVGIACALTGNRAAALLAASALILFREIGSYLPPSTITQATHYLAQFVPFVRSGHFTTHLAFGRFLTPEWTFLPLSLFFISLIVSIRRNNAFPAVAAGIFFGSLFYSYPFDWLAAGMLLGMLMVIALALRDWPAVTRTMLTLSVGLFVSIPYWLNYFHFQSLPQAAEVLARTGIEHGRYFRLSLLPAYLFWIPAALWLIRERRRQPLAPLGAAIYLTAFAVMNIQIVTGYVPTPALFQSYPIALFLWAGHLILGSTLLARLNPGPHARRLLWAGAGVVLALIVIKNVQIPFGYAREQGPRYALPSGTAGAFAWLRTHAGDRTVVLSSSFETNPHLLIYTPVKIFLPPNAVITSAPNNELIERYVITQKLFGVDDASTRERFIQEALPAILHNSFYASDFDTLHTGRARTVSALPFLTHLERTLADWPAASSTLARKYKIDYLYVTRDDRVAPPFCISEVYKNSDVTLYRRC